MQIVNYCLLYYFLGEAKNDYTAAIVGGSIARVALIMCISAVAFVMFLRLRKDGSRNLLKNKNKNTLVQIGRKTLTRGSYAFPHKVLQLHVL